jgi:predicted lipoprotein with Yx(FWY)xxD motif
MAPAPHLARHPHTTRLLVPATAVALLALAGCGSSNGAQSSSSAQATKAAASQAGPAPQAGGAVRAADSSLGRIVVSAKGMTAYVFTKDQMGSGTSVCTGSCLQLWPAITTTATTPTATGVTAKLGTITRSDGSKQLTVAGRPVYTYAPDTQPGDVKGQGVGGVWYVLRPDGSMVTAQSSGGSGNGGY